ncbi:response regulator transcription factor [Thiobacillus sp.]|jgi:DNA-binding NarL/FixJ family response regulator|uniref:response regulator transcription factor n=1 Tax=Thiobacillus sp. TaxID=924 RepID=UPI0025FBB9EA|nr:response regulator transcription factor [Thiobacillus sp.]
MVFYVRDAGMRVVVLTIADTDEETSDAISGVESYIVKSSESEHVLRALSAILGFRACRSRFPLDITQGMARDESPTTTMEALSTREMEIVEFVKQGLSNKIIGHKTKLSENTVRNHLRNIMGKLGLKNRVQLATMALKEDWCRRRLLTR